MLCNLFPVSILLLCLTLFWLPGVVLSGMQKIIGGSNAQPLQFPFHVSIRADGKHKCGGCILNEKYIVTAAHCLDKFTLDSLQVFVGSIYLNNGTAVAVANKAIHEDFNNSTLEHDIGIMQLSTPLVYSESVQPALLPSQGDDVPVGMSATMIGWGTTSYPFTRVPNTLQMLNCNTVSNSDCSSAFKVYMVDGQCCCRAENKRGPCFGDSGGPLMDGNNNNTVFGLVSWGQPCAKPYPDVYTRISFYIDWLANQQALMDAQLAA